MMVPMPTFLIYFWKNAMISAKKLIIGEMILVMLSPTRYTTCESSGEYPRNIKIGINVGASIAHFADALPMNIFKVAAKIIKSIIIGIRPISFLQ
jgi:hypothetical protein